MPKRTGRNQAIDAGANGESRSACSPVERRGLIEDDRLQRGFDNRQRVHGFARKGKGPLLHESLQNLLYDRQTRDDVVEIYERLE